MSTICGQAHQSNHGERDLTLSDNQASGSNEHISSVNDPNFQPQLAQPGTNNERGTAEIPVAAGSQVRLQTPDTSIAGIARSAGNSGDAGIAT